jgi:uncharacterized protein
LNPFRLLSKYYDPASELYFILATHSVLVAREARKIAGEFNERHPQCDIDLEFLTEAALLHDIGIRDCDAEDIFCFGQDPYLRHGVIGREILEKEGLPRHALVCERHTGAGISVQEVRSGSLPLPERDYLPQSLEEKIICVADKFYGKDINRLWNKKSLAQVTHNIAKWGPEPLARWQSLCAEILGVPAP